MKSLFLCFKSTSQYIEVGCTRVAIAGHFYWNYFHGCSIFQNDWHKISKESLKTHSNSKEHVCVLHICLMRCVVALFLSMRKLRVKPPRKKALFMTWWVECMEYTLITNNQKLKHETTTYAIFYSWGYYSASGGWSTHFFTVLAVNTWSS